MSYPELYEFAQTLPIPISRKALLPKILELAGRENSPKTIATQLEPGERGLFLDPKNSDHPFTKFGNGEPVVLIQRGMADEMTRFVVVKEWMHYFDATYETVSTSEEFEGLLNEFVAPSPERSPAMESEVNAFWMALGVLCPEEKRIEFGRLLSDGKITTAEIAQALRIPEQYVSRLFDPRFKAFISKIRN